jgi:hypothetical protein
LSSSQPSKQEEEEEEEEGSHCQANPVAPDLQNRWHRFWAVWLFRCEGASPEIPEISPEISDFPETLEKSPESPGFTDKFVLSGDFSELAYSPPSRRHQDPFNWYQSLVLRFELNRLELKGCRRLVRYRLSLFSLTAQTTLLGLLMFFMC